MQAHAPARRSGPALAPGADPGRPAERADSTSEPAPDAREAQSSSIGPGQLVGGRYRVLAKIGRGGGGTVYQVEHVGLQKRMALKVLNAELSGDDQFVRRFQREAIAQGSIRHSSIVDVTDCGRSDDGSFYYVMEELEGRTLAAHIAGGEAMPPARALPILGQVCRALIAAHARGIVHRDLKPENIFLIDVEGERDRVKVLDFGICKILSPAGDQPPVSRTQSLMGTPEFMAPEQVVGDPVDHRVDIHAFGAVAYQMLTGVSPFRGRSVFETMKLVQTFVPPAPSARTPELRISARLEALIMRLLEKDPERRPSTMDEVAGELDACWLELGSRPAGGSSPRTPVAASSGSALARPAAQAVPPADKTGTWPLGLVPVRPESQHLEPANVDVERTAAQPIMLDAIDGIELDRPVLPSELGSQRKGVVAIASVLVMLAIMISALLARSPNAGDPLHAKALPAPPASALETRPKPPLSEAKPAPSETKPALPETRPARPETKPVLPETRPAFQEAKRRLPEVKRDLARVNAPPAARRILSRPVEARQAAIPAVAGQASSDPASIVVEDTYRKVEDIKSDPYESSND